MAIKKKTTKEVKHEVKPLEAAPEMKKDEMIEEDRLDPAEEKMLDRILMGVVFFILGWLVLSIVLVVLGYFGVWK